MLARVYRNERRRPLDGEGTREERTKGSERERERELALSLVFPISQSVG